MPKFETTRRVEFADTDAAGIAHFASFFRYMEEAEHAMLRSVGMGVLHHDVDGLSVSWPRVSATCDYSSMAKFEDELEVTIWVSKIGNKSASYNSEFRLGERLVASGKITAVCCIKNESGEASAVAIPPTCLAALERLLP